MLRQGRRGAAVRLGGGATLAALALACAHAEPALARSVSVRDEGRLRFVGSSATALIDEGPIGGTLPGRARVRFVYNGSPNVTATFTIRTSGGSLSGSARCRLSNPASPTPSFRGALRISGGSGRYARARGSGELFGVFHRHGYGLVVQAIGRMSY